MIESSIIKLILIIILNMCFVWIWVKKESLRRVMPFRIIRKLEEKAFLKKVEKLISFIGNINIFWTFNMLYVVITAKAFEKVLDITLGFSYGLKYIEKSIETPFFKVDYLGVKTLDEIATFILDIGNMPTLFIGVTALMIPIYLYIIGFKSKSKRQLLLMLTKKGDMFYISFFIYVMLFFKVEKLFLVGAIGYLIFLLMEAVKWIMKIENSLYSLDSFKGLDKKLKPQGEEDIVKLYNATLNELYQGVKNNDIFETDENKKLLLLLLKNNIIKKISVKSRGELISKLFDIYDVSIKNQDDDIFYKISDLHMDIAQYYLKNNDKENFYWSLYGVTKVYDYYYKNGTDKFALDVVSGFRFDIFGIYEEYKENVEECIEWYCQKFKAITEGIKRAVKNNDFYFFKEFIYLVGQEFEYTENLKRDYQLLEKSVYFGVLLYLKEEKIKNKEDKETIKKIDVFIEFMEKKILNDSDLINLIELYEFIGEEMIGNRGMLNWESYFEPKMELVRATVWDGREKNERDKLFFELLGKTEFKEWEKDCILTGKLERYVQFKSVFNKAIKTGEDKLLERLKEFKEKADWRLKDLKEYKNKIDITEENYKEVEDLLIEYKNDTEQKEKVKIRESEISLDKIETMKEILKNILSTSRVIKMLNRFGKYKEKIKDQDVIPKVGLFGIKRWMQKEYFTEIRGEGGVKAIAKSFGQGQNRGIEQIIVNKLESEKEDENRIEDALSNIKGKPWIILTGTDMFSFFYEESGEDRKNIILSSDLGKEYFEKYGEILEGIYKNKGVESPIYNLDSDKEGIYILDSNDIEVFTHYNPNFKLQDNEGIEKEFDDLIEYASLKITDTKKILEKRKEEVLKYEWLQEYDSGEEKIKHFKELVLVEFNQKGELKLEENAKVYKVEFNG